MYFSYAPRRGLYPEGFVEDTDANWDYFLNNSNLKELHDKATSSCVRGAQYYPAVDCLARSDSNEALATEANICAMWGALYDLDEWPHGVLTPTEIWQRYGEHRIILWTSYSHTPEEPRYKVFVPFAESVPPNEFKHHFSPRLRASAGGLGADGQYNADRLAYFNSVQPGNRQHAQYWIGPGERMDVRKRFGPALDLRTGMGIEVRTNVVVPTDDLLDKRNWLSDAETITKARRYFAKAAKSVDPGARHASLFKWGCRLLWDFWLNEDQALEILLELNNRFRISKSPSEVRADLNGAWKRARSEEGAKDQKVAAGCMRQKEAAPETYVVEDKVRLLKKSKNPKEKQDGLALERAVVEQKAGGWYISDEPAIFYTTVAPVLASCFPTSNSDALFEVLSPSWLANDGDNQGISEAQIKSLITQALQKIANKNQEEADAVEEDRRERIREAFAQQRDTPYTHEEIASFASAHGISQDEFHRRYVIKVGRLYYLFLNNTYTEDGFDSTSLYSKAKIVLAPFSDYTSQKVVMGELKEKTLNEFQDDYVTIAGKARVDLNAKYSTYDALSDTFVDATIRFNRDIIPVEDAFAKAFIESFPHADYLKWWLSWLTDLSQPLQALYLEGVPGGGKTLFCTALSKIYTSKLKGEMVPMRQAVKKFSVEWLYNPLFFADEKLPSELAHDLAGFREHITMGNRYAERKGIQAMPVAGYLRYVIIANNNRALPQSKEGTTTEADLRATMERIFYLDMGDGPLNFLKQQQPEVIDSLVTHNRLANYVAFLSQNRQRATGRFPIQVPESRTLINLGRQDGLSDALEWLMSELQKVTVVNAVSAASGKAVPLMTSSIPTVANKRAFYAHSVRSAGENYLAVSLEQMCQHWDDDRPHLTYKNRPRPRDLKATLAIVSAMHKGKQRDHRRENARFLLLDPQKLVEQAALHELSGERFEEQLVQFFAQQYEQENRKVVG